MLYKCYWKIFKKRYSAQSAHEEMDLEVPQGFSDVCWMISMGWGRGGAGEGQQHKYRCSNSSLPNPVTTSLNRLRLCVCMSPPDVTWGKGRMVVKMAHSMGEELISPGSVRHRLRALIGIWEMDVSSTSTVLSQMCL